MGAVEFYSCRIHTPHDICRKALAGRLRAHESFTEFWRRTLRVVRAFSWHCGYGSFAKQYLEAFWQWPARVWRLSLHQWHNLRVIAFLAWDDHSAFVRHRRWFGTSFYTHPGHCRRWENMVVKFLQTATDMDGNTGKPWHKLPDDSHYDWWMQQTDNFVKTFLPTVKTSLLKLTDTVPLHDSL